MGNVSGVRAQLPQPRGPVSAGLVEALAERPGWCTTLWPGDQSRGDTALADEDTQLALYTCYELSYRGFNGVADDWEWDPALLELRRTLERRFEAALRSVVAPPDPGIDARRELESMARGGSGPSLSEYMEKPSLSEYMEKRGTLDQARELAVHRSAYQLKEADPHTWAIPRLSGQAKATMVRLQADEYGGGVTRAMHSSLFEDSMRALGLDATYGAYLDLIPGVTLATVNLVSMLGLHRRWRGALVGHLALFEMTSVGPMARYSRGLERLGLGEQARHFYDVHVVADVEHERLALNQMVSGLLEDEPGIGPDIVTGARWLMELEGRLSQHILGRWRQNRTSLRAEADLTVAA